MKRKATLHNDFHTKATKITEVIRINSSVHQETNGKLRLLSDNTMEDCTKILKSYKKFTFVRDLFQRFPSAYKDCVWGSSREATDIGKNYAKKI